MTFASCSTFNPLGCVSRRRPSARGGCREVLPALRRLPVASMTTSFVLAPRTVTAP
jgi:hypothetical protein